MLGNTFRTGICVNNNVEQRVVLLIAENTTEERTEPATPAQPLTNVVSETAHVSWITYKRCNLLYYYIFTVNSLRD